LGGLGRIASASVAAIGVVVCVGWIAGIPALVRLGPTLVTMKLTTALALTALGVALWRSIGPEPPGGVRAAGRVTRALAIAAGAIAAATLVEYALDVDLGIDAFADRDPTVTGGPGRMSPVTAGCVVALATALLALETRWAEWLALGVALTAQLALLGCLYGPRLYSIGSYSSVALHTAIALLVLALGVLMARPRRGLMGLVSSSSPGGVLARRLLPAAVVLPAVLALILQAGEQAGLYGTGSGRAMLVAASSVLFIALIWWTAATVVRADTRRRAAEDATREREADLAITLNSIGDAVIATDQRGRVVRMNAVAERLTGWPSSEASGRALEEVFQIVDEATGAPVASPAERVLREGIVVGLANHTLLIARDGASRAIANSGAPIRNAAGATRGVVVVFHDQSEARAADRRLRALAGVSRAFAEVATTYLLLLDTIARTIADLVGDACLVTLISEDGDHLVNVATAHRDAVLEREYKLQFAGISVPRATSTSVSAVAIRTGQASRADVTPSAMVSRSEDVLRALVTRLDVHSYAVVPIRAGGTAIGALSLVRNHPGRGYTEDDVVLLQDLADRAGLAIENARLYAQLEQRVGERTAELETTNKELEAFSYSVAHDLRAPLRTISGFSQALLEDCADLLDPAALKNATRVRDAAHHMSELIDDLLQLSRIGRAELRRERVDVSELARVVVARLRADQPERDVEVVIEPGLVARADRRLLEIVLTNLLGNAWKFTGKRQKARIELAAHPGARPPIYLVRDNGAGFAASQVDKLFGVFQRLHRSDEFEGTGIGLATVQRIILRHGGRIWAEGEVDHGATFLFTLEAASSMSDRVWPQPPG